MSLFKNKWFSKLTGKGKQEQAEKEAAELAAKEQAEKEAYKFDCEGAHKMGDKWMPCSMHEHNH